MTTIWLITALFLTTFIHHIYGGIKYNSPKRLKLAALFIVIYAVTCGLYALKAQTWALWTYSTVVAIGWVGMLGLFEGGYSHTIKVVLWLAKVKPSKLQKLFPPEEYVLPNDFWFEATGVATLALGVLVALSLFY